MTGERGLSVGSIPRHRLRDEMCVSVSGAHEGSFPPRPASSTVGVTPHPKSHQASQTGCQSQTGLSGPPKPPAAFAGGGAEAQPGTGVALGQQDARSLAPGGPERGRRRGGVASGVSAGLRWCQRPETKSRECRLLTSTCARSSVPPPGQSAHL